MDLGYHSFTGKSKLLVVSVESNSTLFLFLISDGDYSKKGIMILEYSWHTWYTKKLHEVVLVGLIIVIAVIVLTKSYYWISYYIMLYSFIIITIIIIIIVIDSPGPTTSNLTMITVLLCWYHPPFFPTSPRASKYQMLHPKLSQNEGFLN